MNRIVLVTLCSAMFLACGSDRPGKSQQTPQAVCGNGTVEDREACDGSNYDGETCASLGYVGGTLACFADCSDFDTGGCHDCGDNVIDFSETCDGQNLNNKDCRTLNMGFTGGTLACNPATSAQRCTFNTSQCNSNAVCNDGIRQGNEQCDGNQLNSATCRTLGFTDGTLSCAANCTFNTSLCTNVTCGNNAAEGAEACDGTDLKGGNCRTLGFAAGTLTCKADCTGYVTTACTGTAPVCGNNAAEGSEACDGTDLKATDCRTLGFTGGTLTCRTDCTGFVTTQCTGTGPQCNNNTIEGNEVCDGTQLAGKSCRDFGFTAGTLTCKADCTGYVTTACTGTGPACNNNAIETGEVCDGTALANLTCTSFGFAGGNLACATGCLRFNTAGCTGGGSNSCGDSLANGLDLCDGADWGGPAPVCTDYGLGTGNVTCTTTCGPNLSACQTTDYCDAAAWYSDGWCDPCEKLGGTVDDADCAETCIADGFCSDYYAMGAWTCKKYGLIDPDCGQCGDNTVSGNEYCDGTSFMAGGDTCVAYGYGTGTLTCAANCIPNFSQCAQPACGNNTIEGTETCDGSDLGGALCADFGYTGGTLDCLNDCSDLDFSACTAETQGDCCQATPGAPGCNDTQDPGLEACVCGLDNYCCTVEWDSFCVDTATNDCGGCQAGTCGDGNVQPGEVCDGSNFAGRACADYGFSGGSLTCEACTSISTAACTGGDCCVSTPGAGGCTDAGVESCVCADDPYCCTNEWDATCVDEVDIFGCGTCAACGDNLASGAEYCDGSDLRGLDCTVFGFATGNLGCQPGCLQFDTSACEVGGTTSCGDGIVNGLDECDGAAVTCASLGLGTTGNALCTAACVLDTSPCTPQDYCASRSWYNDGWCDACDRLGGVPDEPDCAGTCNGGDGLCHDYFFAGVWSCWNAGYGPDPDCGVCGGATPTLEGEELCDGTQFNTGAATCADWGYDAGDLTCDLTWCIPDFSGCYMLGDCCTPTPGIPGCNDGQIETDVCGQDSYCCTTEWDTFCVDQATNDFGWCSNTPAPADNCCTETVGTPGCLIAAVETCVCGQDPYCCSTEWDSVCVQSVADFGCGLCGAEGDCCTITPDTFGCNNASVEACVCAADSYCCSTAWDDICVAEVTSEQCGVCN